MSLDGVEEYAHLLWLDVESSGLHLGSYPIEVGWCAADLQPTSYLIKPLSSWTIDEWSPEAEQIHGLSRDRLNEVGFAADDIARRLNVAAAGKTVLSDDPAYDDRWLDRLYHDTEVAREFTLLDAGNAARMAAGGARLSPSEAHSYLARIQARYPHPHRAGPDSRRAAAEFLVMAMPHALHEIEEMA